MNCSAVAFVVTLTPLVIAQSPAEKPDDDLKKLQGTWKLIYSETNGNGGKPVNDVRNQVEKDVMTSLSAGELATKCSFKIDSTKKPKTLELTILENRLIPESKGTRISAIYELDGDRLKICVSTGLLSRIPKDFTTKGTNQTVEIFERVKH